MLPRKMVLFLLMGIMGLVIASESARAGENPILAGAKKAIADPKKPFTMLIRLKVKEGTDKKFEKAFAKARVETRKEKGNLTYDLNRDSASANTFVVYERWRNRAALVHHMEAEYITELLAQIEPILDGEPAIQFFYFAAQ